MRERHKETQEHIDRRNQGTNFHQKQLLFSFTILRLIEIERREVTRDVASR